MYTVKETALNAATKAHPVFVAMNWKSGPRHRVPTVEELTDKIVHEIERFRSNPELTLLGSGRFILTRDPQFTNEISVTLNLGTVYL